MLSLKTPDHSGVNKLYGLLFSLSVLGLASCSQVGPESAETSAPKGPEMTAYSGIDSCAGDKRNDCGDRWHQAKEIASALSWGFASEFQCKDSFGDQCLQSGGEWKPAMVGMAVISRSENSFSTSVPVFSSSKFPGLYLPNGYPVVWGKNTLSRVFQSFGVMGASRPRGLTERVCVDVSGEESCGPLHQFVSGISHDEKALAEIF